MGHCGRENLCKMTISTFKVSRDENDRRYLHQVIKELEKNYTEEDFNASNEACIYEKKGQCYFKIDSKNNLSTLVLIKPYIKPTTKTQNISFLFAGYLICLYVKKLNKKLDALWQHPKGKHFNKLDAEWYENSPVGRDSFNETMKLLSKNAKLSRIIPISASGHQW